jgi:hypothetical protein
MRFHDYPVPIAVVGGTLAGVIASVVEYLRTPPEVHARRHEDRYRSRRRYR